MTQDLKCDAEFLISRFESLFRETIQVNKYVYISDEKGDKEKNLDGEKNKYDDLGRNIKQIPDSVVHVNAPGNII